MRGVKQTVGSSIISVAAIVSILLVLAFFALDASTASINVPTFHLDGAFQTASGLFRIDAGQAPGRDFLPYLGIAPLLLLFPFFKALGGTLTASVFTAKFITVVLGWFSLSALFHFVFRSKRVLFSLLGGAAGFILLFFIKSPPVLGYILSFGLEPGNSLKPIRSFAPYLAALSTYFLLTRLSGSPLRSYLAGVLVAIILLWSNDFAIPTAGVFLAFFCGYFWFNERASWLRSIVTVVGVGLVLWALLLTLFTAGHPLALLEYNFLDVARDQWWFFGPYGESTRVFDIFQIGKVVNGESETPLQMLLAVLVIAVVTRKLEDVLLVLIGLTLFFGGTLASVGGHLGDYYLPFYYWATLMFGLLGLRGGHLLLPLLTRKAPLPWHWLAVPVCIVMVVVTVQRGMLYNGRLAATEANTGMFYVPEFAGYMGNEWKPYIEYARLHHGSKAVEDYWGIWSSFNRSFSEWPVDSLIHALGGVRESAKQTLPHADLRITTRYATSPVWQPWNLSQSFWFYEDLLTNWEPDFISPTSVVWRRTETSRKQPDVGCLISDDKKEFILDSSDAGFYKVRVSYSVTGSGRFVLMLRNNVSYGNDAKGYVSLPTQSSTITIPALINEATGSRFNSKVIGNPDVALDLISCTASKIAYENREILTMNPGTDFYLTDVNWINGISRKEPEFFDRNRSPYTERYQVGRFVFTPNGEVRKILRVTPNGEYLNIYVDGPVFDAAAVGFPSAFKVADTDDAYKPEVPISFYLTDGNWEGGIARNWAGFFVPSNHYFATRFRVGAKVKFGNGEVRSITSVRIYGPYLNVYVDGVPLKSGEVGLPNSFSIVEGR